MDPSNAVIAPVGTGPDYRVLVVRRHQSVAEEIVGSVMQHRGHAVEFRPLGPAAFVDLSAYHLIVLELADDDPGGLMACSRLREVSRVPLLVLVASRAKHQGIRALELGADTFVLMPFDRRELAARSEALMRRYDR